jgi:ComF family protein
MDHECGQCQSETPQFSMARAFGRYEGALRRLIHNFKYGGCVQLAKPLGRLLFKTFVRQWGPDRIDQVVPVPLHSKRLRRRGYNQAQLLVREWPRCFKIAGLDSHAAAICDRSLIRQRDTAPQTGLSRWQRTQNIRQAFRLAGPAPIADRRILLVDDVMTTGATANACTGTLLQAGAREVLVLTLALAV